MKFINNNNYLRIKDVGVWLCQKVIRGWSDHDILNLDSHLARLILPRLVHFSKVQKDGPSDLSDDEWKMALEQMISSFTWLSNSNRHGWDSYKHKSEEAEAARGMELFGKYFTHLWFN